MTTASLPTSDVLIHEPASVYHANIVTFATRKFRVEREDAGFNRERGIAHAVGRDGGERILRTVGGPSCVAKNRYNLPAELPLTWDALLNAIVGNATPAAA